MATLSYPSLRRWFLLCLFLAVTPVAPGNAGEIPGIRPPLPARLATRAELYWGNDFFGGGGAVDDFRTQQVIVSGRLRGPWSAVLDHSILTLKDPSDDTPAHRVDQLSASVGYSMTGWVPHPAGTEHDVTIGLGLRASGNYQGQRIQNGFHRLVDSKPVDLPYADSHGPVATTWLRTSLAGPIGSRGKRWQPGYWLYGATLLASDADWDGTVGAYATLGPLNRSRGLLWLGLRGDWRVGHDQDPVQAAAANNEAGFYGGVGLALGPLVLETHRNLNRNDAFGSIHFLAAPEAAIGETAGDALALHLGLTAPDVLLRLQGDWSPSSWRGSGGSGFAITATAARGEPPLEESTERYVTTTQLTAGLEWQAAGNGVHPFAGVGLGVREERLTGQGETSVPVRRGVLTGDLGMRVDAYRWGEQTRLQLQLGLTGWLPTTDAEVEFRGDTEHLQRPGVAVATGLSLVWSGTDTL